MTFGGYNETQIFNNSAIKYSPMGLESYYEVPLNSIQVRAGPHLYRLATEVYG